MLAHTHLRETFQAVRREIAPFKDTRCIQAFLLTSGTPALMLRQETCLYFEASLGYGVGPSLKQTGSSEHGWVATRVCGVR